MEILKLETLAANAWPSRVVQPLDGWRLRFMDGVTQRANSVWPNGRSATPLSLATKIAQVEEFYAAHSTPALYQISPASQPAELVSTLEERGYSPSPPTHVMGAQLAQLAFPQPPRAYVELLPAPPTDWYGAAPTPAEQVRLENLRRIRPPAAFVRIWRGERSVARGHGVLEDGWLGVYGIETAPDLRRRGWGTAVVSHLCRWAQDNRGQAAYLQVFGANHPAIALYAKLGFEQQYSYQYWENTRQPHGK